MTDRYHVSETFFKARSKMTPRNAVAAIIVDEQRRLLVQLRDDKEEIFFPNHWGCFGGAMEPGESPDAALVRELHEELGIVFEPADIAPFINIAFTPRPDLPPVDRHFFIVTIHTATLQAIRLNEGSGYEWMTYPQLMRLPNVTPYDKFGMWLYFNQGRLGD